MPVEVESSSQIEDILRILRKRFTWVLVPLSLCLAVGTTFAILVPKKYVATERVMVREVAGKDGKPLGSAGGEVAAHVIKAPKRVKAVIEALRWPWASLTRDEKSALLERTIGNLTVSSPSMGTRAKEQIVTISFAHTDPTKALRFTQATSESWREEVLEASRNATEKSFDKLRERRGQMQKRLTQISDEISSKHRKYGIPPWDPTASRERPLAPEFEELLAMGVERRALGEELLSREFEVEQLEAEYSKMDDLIPFETTVAGQSYQKKLTLLQESMQKDQLLLTTNGYRPDHSAYKKIQARIALYKEAMSLLTETRVETVLPTEMQQNTAKLLTGEQLREGQEQIARMVKRIEALDKRMDNTEARTRELQTVYQELADLQAERTNLYANLKGVDFDYTRMDVLLTEVNSSAGNPFTLLEQAELPTIPTEPSVPLIILGSAVLGLILGLGASFMAEYGRNCFRTVNDITRIMVVPVLGTVNTIITARQRRRHITARAVLGGATLLVIGVLAFVTYAWELNQSLLSDGLLESIKGFRRAFE